MDLHQIQVTYRAEEDRVLWRASFKAEDGSLQEIRAWLTRRMVKGLWPRVIDALEKQVALDKPHAAHASSDIVGMEHDVSIEHIRDSGSFDSVYQDDITDFPLGAAPILVTRIDFALNPGQPVRMRLLPADGQGFEIAFTRQVLHGFCSLLRDAVKKADWDINLMLPGAATGTPRVLN